MKEIRLCDDGDIEYTANLCSKNNLGIECKIKYLEESIKRLKELKYIV